MISLKKHMDNWTIDEPDPILQAYRALLKTFGGCSSRAVPELGKDLQQKLAQLDKSLWNGVVNGVRSNL